MIIRRLRLQQGRADGLEVRQVHAARGRADDAHPLPDFLGGVVGRAQQTVQSGHQRLDVGRQQSALVEVGHQVLHGQQGMDFRGVEPQARQFELAAGVRGAALVAVAARLAVPDQRAVEAVAQVLDVALERGRRHFQCILQFGEGHQLALADQLVDLVEAFGAVHSGLREGMARFYVSLNNQAHPVSL